MSELSVDSSFIRLHQPPKVCRTTRTWGAKQSYYYRHSLARYEKTADGRRYSEMIRRMLSARTGEIGRVDSIRFVESK